jgi:hypothetical protein
MKKMALCVAAAAMLAIAPARAAETLKGTIGDSMCSVKHTADKHGDKSADHRKCVEKCISDGGKYIFMSDGKVFKIANQDFKDLKAHAAHEVMLTGDLKGDTLTVAKIEMPAAKK